MTRKEPFRPIPRSVLDDTVWPAVPAPGPAMLMALSAQLEDSQWLPASVHASRQQKQLAQLLGHAVRTIPFYAERLRKAGYAPSLEGDAFQAFWRQLPVLRRDEIAIAPNLIRSKTVPASHGAVRMVSTSGTSGAPLPVAKSQLEQLMWQAITLREELWSGRDWRDTLAVIRNFGEARYKEPQGVRLADWGTPLADVYPTGGAVALDMSCPIEQQLAFLVQHQPGYLLADAGILRRLAEACRARGLALPHLREVRAIGDVVDADLRRLCHDAWQVAVTDIYSCTEAGYLALQCREHGSLHLQSETVLVEVLDDAGHLCKPGETGEVVVTTLHNFATPFIRYAINDRATVGMPCRCGRGLPVLARVLGRTNAST